MLAASQQRAEATLGPSARAATRIATAPRGDDRARAGARLLLTCAEILRRQRQRRSMRADPGRTPYCVADEDAVRLQLTLGRRIENAGCAANAWWRGGIEQPGLGQQIARRDAATRTPLWRLRAAIQASCRFTRASPLAPATIRWRSRRRPQAARSSSTPEELQRPCFRQDRIGRSSRRNGSDSNTESGRGVEQLKPGKTRTRS